MTLLVFDGFCSFGFLQDVERAVAVLETLAGVPDPVHAYFRFVILFALIVIGNGELVHCRRNFWSEARM